MKERKIFIISGEASGDLHGSNLVREILAKNNLIKLQGWGGELMQAQGVQILKHYRELAFMGFAEVLKNINTIRKNFIVCKQQISDFKPDAVLFIDYPGFNLRMAKWAKQNGYKTIYYISPQIWAWKENRIHTIKKVVDEMLVILPFEKEYYQKWDYAVHYVGHPLVQVINNYKKNSAIKANTNTIALLPGSRKQEILEKLPIMLAVAKHFSTYTFVVAMAPGIEKEFYAAMLQSYTNVKALKGDTYGLLANASAALVTSGTATLETALFKVPQVVCYKGNKLSYLIAKQLVKIKYISLVNLIMNKLVVEELIQDAFNEIQLKEALAKILTAPLKDAIIADYQALEIKLSVGGDASKNAANLVLRNME